MHPFARFGALAVALVALGACGGGGPDYSSELDETVRIEDVAELRLPVNLASGPLPENTDTDGFWVSERIRLQYGTSYAIEEGFGYSQYAEFSRREIEVDGRYAVAIVFRMDQVENRAPPGDYRAAMWVPDEPWKPGLSLWANCATRSDCDLMTAAFETVRFIDGYQPPPLDTLAAVGEVAELLLPASLASGAMGTNAVDEGSWAVDRLRLQYTVGPEVNESPESENRPSYQQQEVQVDGRTAIVATYEAAVKSSHPSARNYHAALWLPAEGVQPGLSLLADCATPADCEVMLDAFETLRFVDQ